jgi:hypothetical protein
LILTKGEKNGRQVMEAAWHASDDDTMEANERWRNRDDVDILIMTATEAATS